MGTRSVSGIAAGLAGAVAIAVLLIGTGSAFEASARPVRLEPGLWYAVSPAQFDRASAKGSARIEQAPVAFRTGDVSEDSSTGGWKPMDVAVLKRVFPAGSAVWLAVSGGLLVLTASLFRAAAAGGGIIVRRSKKNGAASTEGSE